MPVHDNPVGNCFPAPPPAEGPVEFDWLFLDLNSYFASVEQQTRPELRGRPVAVVPVDTDYTCAIAASYPAKAFGIKTGTMIREARLKCPQLVCVLADHKKYVEFHHRILEELDRHIPVEKIMSVDEVACRLSGEWRTPAGAIALAHRIKQGIAKNVGECLTSSIGISTNRLLAKIASDLHKPDGLTTLHPRELPGRLAHLALHDLPGIGPNMERRLWAARIDSIDDLWAAAPKQLRAIWGSVQGERFWYALRGLELPEEATTRWMVGHSHVLAPEHRPASEAGIVARRLLLKAASRLRRMGYYATQLDLGARIEKGPRIGLGTRFEPVCDSFALLRSLAGLWEKLIQETGGVRFKKISVTLHGLVPEDELRQLSLFSVTAMDSSAPPASSAAEQIQRQRRERLSAAMEAANLRHGRDAVTLGVMPGTVKNFTGSKVAFNRVPDRRDFDDLLEKPSCPSPRKPIPDARTEE
jgi:DNA polymerase-4